MTNVFTQLSHVEYVHRMLNDDDVLMYTGFCVLLSLTLVMGAHQVFGALPFMFHVYSFVSFLCSV